MFVEVNRSMQADKSVTGSMVIPCIRSIKVHLDTFKPCYCTKLHTSLQKAVT